jgi:hypothetical protein
VEVMSLLFSSGKLINLKIFKAGVQYDC